MLATRLLRCLSRAPITTDRPGNPGSLTARPNFRNEIIIMRRRQQGKVQTLHVACCPPNQILEPGYHQEPSDIASVIEPLVAKSRAGVNLLQPLQTSDSHVVVGIRLPIRKPIVFAVTTIIVIRKYVE